MAIAKTPFGTLPDGTAVDLFTFDNRHGVRIRAMTYGGTIVSLEVPDRSGQLDDIVLGYDNLAGYLRNSPYFGAIVGRYANRIARGVFTLDGKTYTLATNNGPNHLHGGVHGFDKVVWHATPFETAEGSGVILRYTSPDGEEGYPGTLSVSVTYTLTSQSELRIDYEATADQPTIINLSQHSYFNLTGMRRDVLDHELMIAASRYTPVDATLIPTGELVSVAGTPFDFRDGQRIGARIEEPSEQLVRAGGYDHNFVLDRDSNAFAFAARLGEPESGRVLEVHTTEPGMQLYSGNFLDGSIRGKGGRVYGHRYGVCLETQHFPNSPNEPEFPSTVLRPGMVYRSQTVFRFGVESI